MADKLKNKKGLCPTCNGKIIVVRHYNPTLKERIALLLGREIEIDIEG